MSAIKHIRTSVFHVTQAEFGRVAGASQALVSRWESGIREPTQGHLARIRAAAKERKIRWKDQWLFEIPASAAPMGGAS